MRIPKNPQKWYNYVMQVTKLTTFGNQLVDEDGLGLVYVKNESGSEYLSSVTDAASRKTTFIYTEGAVNGGSLSGWYKLFLCL